jgi:hypothetical protein
MIPVAGFKKKLAAVALALAVAAGAFILVRRPDGKFSWRPSFSVGSARIEKILTIEDYRSAASGAVKGFVLGDAASAAEVLAKLQEVRVPREGMRQHFLLVTAFAAYSDALASGDKTAAAEALVTLKDFCQTESWVGLSFN